MSELDVDAYELLEITNEATEAEIRKAYRQISLKVHPDRNPDNPDAARKFHELRQAYELLLDPHRRVALDAKLRIKKARAERYKTYDSKRKNLVEELEERERAFKKARVDKQKEEAAKWEETEKIKDQGRKMREDKEKLLRQQQQPEESATSDEPVLQDNDTTVRVKYSLADHPNLTTSESIASLFSPFGPVDDVVLRLKSPKKAPKKAIAFVPFKRIGDAFTAVCASGQPQRGLQKIEVSWVGGKEPQILSWLRKNGQLGSADPISTQAEHTSQANASNPTAFSSFPDSLPDVPNNPSNSAQPVIDYESLTLMRLRQAERERLEKEIREQEEDE